MTKEKYATIEILKDGEVILGSTPSGRYMVREYEDDIEMGAEFFDSILLAEKWVLEFQGN
tara:strand:- start:11 stop:190 length:180 start_codon:yes stop_codon:yes gene_type:complete